MNSRGLAWRRSGNLDRAIADFDQAIRLNPKDVAAYNNRAMALADRRDFDRAAADYDQALKLDPKYALAYLNRGLLWQAQEGLRPRHRRFRSGDPSRARQRGGASTPAASRSTLKGEFDRAHRRFRPGHRARTRQRQLLRQPRQRLARPRPLRPRRRGLRQGDRAVAELCLRLLQPLAGALSGRPVCRGAGRRRQGRGAQREFGRGAEPARADPGEARRPRRRHRRSAAGRGARSGLLQQPVDALRRLGVPQ